MVSLKLGLMLFGIGSVFVFINLAYQRELINSALACPGCVEDWYAALAMYRIYGIPGFIWYGGVIALIGLAIIMIKFTLKKAMILAGLGFMIYVAYNVFTR